MTIGADSSPSQMDPEAALTLDLALADIRVAKDILVVGLEELERDRDAVGAITYPVWREGIVLYDRAA